MDSVRKLTLKAELGGIHNEWDVWVYPEESENGTAQLRLHPYLEQRETKQWLNEGKNVLLIPEKCKGRKAHFASHFWNPIMFNWNPMIVGTLIDNEHPAFRDFPHPELCRLAMVGHRELFDSPGTRRTERNHPIDTEHRLHTEQPKTGYLVRKLR